MARFASGGSVGLLFLLVGALACGRSAPPRATRTRAPVPNDCQPMSPPPSLEMPEALKRALPRDEKGRPVLMGGLVYDALLDDPTTRWASCLSRVSALMEANRGPGRLAHCIGLIDVCATDEGGENCCPQSCLDAFERQRAAGLDDRKAVDASFLKGTCVKGFDDPAPKR